MAKLIKCAGCGEEISKNAKSCPHCGEPKEESTSLLTWIIVFAIGFFIFGSIFKNTDSPSSSMSNTEIKAQQEKAKDLKYFAQSKKIIIQDINHKIQNKQYYEVIKITTKYPIFRGKSKDISKIHTEVVALLAKEKIEKQKKHKKEILQQLKSIPSSEYTKNKQLYQTLLNYEPNNKKYKEKVEFYSNKLKIATQKEKIKLAIFGEKPTQSSWDGSYYAVETYLKRVARDPDSVKISNCTQVYEGKEGWLVGCEWRGKNGFGGMNATVNWFTIRQNKVILMEKASAYKLN